MGYLPEEEMSYKQTTAKAAAEAAALRDQYEVRAVRSCDLRLYRFLPGNETFYTDVRRAPVRVHVYMHDQRPEHDQTVTGYG